MPDPIKYIRKHLTKFEFEDLFNELGWDNYALAWPQVESEGRRFNLTGVAEKRGMVVVHCTPDDGQAIPPYTVRKKIESQVTKSAFEHLLIFTDATKAQQVWQFARREHGQSVKVRELLWHQGQSGEDLIQRLSNLAIDINDEDTLTLQDVVKRAQSQLDVEKVTKKFYQLFDKQKNAFTKAITGIGTQGDQEWYASVMLNRLMFVYFVQKKGFLNGDRDYLRTRMAECQMRLEQNQFHNFYRSFLLVLFHDGLNKRQEEHTKELKELVGDVPYLNGGIFDIHKIEETYGEAIDIPDTAFEKIFDFFDDYRWHLDDNPIVDGNEINPDVLGYIFEKFINQKQMGAYYTKEDITEYISKNTIIPHLFDRIDNVKGTDLSYAFDLLKEDPDRYIYDAIKHGWAVNIHERDSNGQAVKLDKVHDLPAEIQSGLERLDDWDLADRRKCWNRFAPGNVGLPTEIWREVVDRRERYYTLKEKLATGRIREIKELITLNLDIITFAKDAIDRCPDKKTLAKFWKTLTSMTVLDPTCGSGAFLLAALEILEPLYEATLSRMDGLCHDLSNEEKNAYVGSDVEFFQGILDEVAKHPNRSYSILKRIIVQNLYGVDIIEEAVEISKLRLFLKLVSKVEVQPKEVNSGIEPLPDIDFNIKAGNTLVGFATETDLKAQKPPGNQMETILSSCKALERHYSAVAKDQVKFNLESVKGDKMFLMQKLASTRALLDVLLANTYGIDVEDNPALERWKASHKPFHWLCEFPNVMNNGSFDVIIFSPPFVSYTKSVAKDYKVHCYKTISCNDLYSFIIERILNIGCNKTYFGATSPTASVSTTKTEPLRKLIYECCSELFLSHFSAHGCPSKLFEESNHRLTFWIGKTSKKVTNQETKVYSTKYQKWYADERKTLFENLQYDFIPKSWTNSYLPKIYCKKSKSIFSKLIATKSLGPAYNGNKYVIFYYNAPIHWVKAFNFLPRSWNERDGDIKGSHYKELSFNSEENALSTIAALNTTLSYFWFIVTSNCRDYTSSVVKSFPFNPMDCSPSTQNELALEANNLMCDFQENSSIKVRMQRTTGRMELQEIDPRKSKYILDKIDLILGQHLGLTLEEIDFITNYDIKYRLGKDSF